MDYFINVLSTLLKLWVRINWLLFQMMRITTNIIIKHIQINILKENVFF